MTIWLKFWSDYDLRQVVMDSKPKLLGVTANDILCELKVWSPPNKVDLRKQFEVWLWQSQETFHNYYHDKIIRINRIPIPDDEILDYVIDGISDVHLRNHARMQNFTFTEVLLRAFKKIFIRPDLKNRRWQVTRSKLNTRILSR